MTDSADDAGLRHQIDGPVATITLCRPEAGNAQSPLLWAALRDIGASLPGSVRVVVIRAGGKSFNAAWADQVGSFPQDFSWLQRPDLVTVAAVHGHAVGAGFQLALACDLRIVADNARFAMPETSLGVVPDLGGIQPLVEAVGYSRALEICLTGREVDAWEALQLGLATLVVPLAELDQAVADLVAALTAPPHEAVTAVKALLRDAAERSRSESPAAEPAAQVHHIRAVAREPSGNKGA